MRVCNDTLHFHAFVTLVLKESSSHFELGGTGHLSYISLFVTITTITTVGYGDFSAHTFLEKFICIFIMLTGVIGFASASGAVTNYIDQMD